MGTGSGRIMADPEQVQVPAPTVDVPRPPFNMVTPTAQHKLYPDDLFVAILDQGNVNVTGVVGAAMSHGHAVCIYLRTHTLAETVDAATVDAARNPDFADDPAATAQTYVHAATTAYCPQ